MCHRVVIVNKDKKRNENNTKIKSSDNIMEKKKNYMKLYGTINKSESQP